MNVSRFWCGTKAKIKLRLLCSCGLLSVSPLLFAADAAVPQQPSEPIGMVLSVHGEVQAVDKANNQRALQRRSDIYLNDTINTAQDSKVQMRLKDDSLIVVQPSSKFYVSEFAFNKSDPGNNRYVGNLIKGALVNVSGHGNPENYQLKSPLTAIAFRGTGLATKLVTAGGVLTRQYVQVFKGYVTVRSLCEKRRREERKEISCEQGSVDVGVGQNMNAVVVETNGTINEFSDSNLRAGAGKKGSISIRCKVDE